VSAGLEDEAMFDFVCARRCGIVLMHHRAPPDVESFSDAYDEAPHYDDVAADVRRFLLGRAEAAQRAGIRADAIVIDPGLGFGKTVEQNFELIRRLRELTDSGYPVLGAASRKSFIGHVTGIAVPRDRIVGSTAVTVAQYFAGVRIFRVHDVAAHLEALRVARAIALMPDPVAAR
jgi:dihydropteroate synthase